MLGAMLRAVLFDVDFTLSRPGPELGPEATGGWERHGLVLDPARYEDARLAAFDDLRSHPELDPRRGDLDHVHRGHRSRHGRCCGGRTGVRRRHGRTMGGPRELRPLRRRRSRPSRGLRRHGLRLGLISNGQRDLEEFARHHQLDVDVAVGSKSHGRTKPHASIFEAALAALGVGATEAVMVGDS